MTEREQAEALSQSMADAANGMGIATSVVLSTMDQPLGCAVGNALEIVESVETLCGRGPMTSKNWFVFRQGFYWLHRGLRKTWKRCINDS